MSEEWNLADLADVLELGAETIRNPSDIDVINRSVARTLEAIAQDIKAVHAGELSVRNFCAAYGLQRQPHGDAP